MANETPASSKKSNLAKLAIGLVLAMAGYGGADAAGYQFDPDQLGGLGGIALAVYLEIRIRPLLAELVALWRGKPIEGQLLEVEATPERADPTPPATPLAKVTQPRLAVARPASAADE